MEDKGKKEKFLFLFFKLKQYIIIRTFSFFQKTITFQQLIKSSYDFTRVPSLSNHWSKIHTCVLFSPLMGSVL